MTKPALTEELATRFARLAMAGILREFPNKPSNVLASAADAKRPRDLHPVFFGCFDWHSAVHSHWTLVRLLKEFPAAEFASDARALLASQLTAEKLRAEADHFRVPDNAHFERMYGWAWALRLAMELRTWSDPAAGALAAAMAPLEQQLCRLTADYLPRLTYPVRSGVHTDTAFALAFVLDYAQTAGAADLAEQAANYARQRYAADRDYPTSYEPSGEDFFSPAWNEADLMQRVLSAESFADWLGRFVPGLASGDAVGLNPAEVSDLTDGRIVHLVGLNLSRSWAQQGVLGALPDDDPRRAVLRESVNRHAKAGLAGVFSGDYAGEHWLATFAVYLLTASGRPVGS
ncbi:MAG: DUF2891 domain-containing protein [Planctomycetota bacterium]